MTSHHPAPVGTTRSGGFARTGRLRWAVLGWLLVGGIINYFDRANLSLAAPQMMKELRLSATDIGLMGSVFSWVYAVMQLPSGWLIDRFGSRRVYPAAVGLWSLATLGMGFCSSMPQFLAARVGLGTGEAPCFPTSAKITASWFPRRDRGLASAIWDSSSKWGPALAPLVLVPVMVAFGWRSVFWVTGLLGLAFVVIFRLFYREPEHSRLLSDAERRALAADRAAETDGENVPWLRLFTKRTTWGLMLGFFCAIWTWNIFLTFLPLYLLKAQGITLGSMGVFAASIPWLGGVVGENLAGWVSNGLVRRGTPPLLVRRAMLLACSLLSGITISLVPMVHGVVPSVALLTVALLFVSAVLGTAWALATDVSPADQVGSVGAVQNFGGYFGGALSPVVAGMIVDHTGSWLLAFVSGGIIAALSGVCYWFIVRQPIQVTPKPL